MYKGAEYSELLDVRLKAVLAIFILSVRPSGRAVLSLRPLALCLRISTGFLCQQDLYNLTDLLSVSSRLLACMPRVPCTDSRGMESLTSSVPGPSSLTCAPPCSFLQPPLQPASPWQHSALQAVIWMSPQILPELFFSETKWLNDCQPMVEESMRKFLEVSIYKNIKY